jgi:hypothetical protein
VEHVAPGNSEELGRMAGPPRFQMSISLPYDWKSRSRDQAFTLIDLLIVIMTLVLFGFVAPLGTTTRCKVSARRINCVNNLRQLGIASRLWATGHDSNFVWQVSTTNGGALESASSGNIVPSFLAMTNELVSPKILFCVSDQGRERGSSFAALSRTNISYFVALDCPFDAPQAILAGDRNVRGGNASNRCIRIRSNSIMTWTKEMHVNAGNLLLADGSVQQVSPRAVNRQIQSQFAFSTNQAITWLLP